MALSDDQPAGSTSPRPGEVRALDAADMGTALDLLERGFPERSRRFWEDGLARMLRHGENLALGVPIGYFLTSKGKAVGVILTLASTHPGPDGPQRVVNLSGWYIEPEHRWRALMMLHRVTGDAGAVYTDLTPTFAVQRIISSLGFRPLNSGVAFGLIPLMALGPRKSQVAPVDALPAGAIAPDLLKRIMIHEPPGFHALAVLDEGAWHPLLFKRRTVRRLPAAQLIYCEKESVLRRHLGPICRSLLRRRFLVLWTDVPVDGTAPGLQRKRYLKFVKGELGRAYIDYLGSEFSYLDLD
jgi:hypothetical protein